MADGYFLKICIIGVPDKLNMALVRTLAGGRFLGPDLPILGVDITTIPIQVNGNNFKLILVVTASDEDYKRTRPSYYRGTSAAIITFDKGDKNSFQAVKEFYTEVKTHFKPTKKMQLQIMRRHPRLFTEEEVEDYKSRSVGISIALVGFVSDSEEVTIDKGENLAEELGVQYFETQPTDKKTIEGIFHNITRKILEEKGP